MKHVGADIGRHRVKCFSAPLYCSFPSYMGAYRKLKNDRQFTSEDMYVYYNSRKYFVGGIAKDEALDGASAFSKSKVNFDTKLLGLVAIHKMVNDNDTISLVTGQPVENHDPKQKEGLVNLFKGSHELYVNGIRKCFTVEQVKVAPEGASTQFIIKDMTAVSHVIDIGSATTNYATWNKGIWVDKLSGTLPYGAENSGLSIDSLGRRIALDVSQRVQEFKGNVYLIGGVANLIQPSMRDYIQEFPIIPVENPMYANALAYYTIGVKVYENSQKK